MTGCAFLALLFLGGWHMPYLDLVMYGIDTPQPVVGFHDGGLMSILHGFGLPIWLLSLLGVILKIKVFLFKVLLLLILMMWVRWTLPRFRFDQLMQLAWRNMIPLTLVILLTTGTFVYLGLQSYMWAANLGILALALTVGPMLPSGPPVNRRVPLPGSRFSPLPTD